MLWRVFQVIGALGVGLLFWLLDKARVKLSPEWLALLFLLATIMILLGFFGAIADVRRKWFLSTKGIDQERLAGNRQLLALEDAVEGKLIDPEDIEKRAYLMTTHQYSNQTSNGVEDGDRKQDKPV